MSQTIVLISGANRGLGKGLLELYLAKPNHTVIAANRDPSHPSSKALSELPVAANSRLIVVKIDATSETDALDAVKDLQSQGIGNLDVVIANSGICYVLPKVSDVKIEDIKAHFEPNVYGVVLLYQATLPFLLKSENPIWATMGSTAGSLQVRYFAFHTNRWGFGTNFFIVSILFQLSAIGNEASCATPVLSTSFIDLL